MLLVMTRTREKISKDSWFPSGHPEESMKTIQLAFATLLVLAVPAFAQNHEKGGGGGGHQAIPKSGPAPVKENPHPVEQNRNYSDKAGHPNAPHVDGKTWVGHDTGKD